MKKACLLVLLSIFFVSQLTFCNTVTEDSCSVGCNEVELNLSEEPVVTEEPTEGEIEQDEYKRIHPIKEEHNIGFVEQDNKIIQPPLKDSGDDILPNQLTPEELVKIDILRDTIAKGIGIGRVKYLEVLSIKLQQAGIHDDYESLVLYDDDLQETEAEIVDCPFAKYYDNGFESSEITCDYLVNIAKVETYSELTKTLDENPPVIGEQEEQDEINFWYEQGAISGIEEFKVLTRLDLKKRSLCNKNPTPVESSFEKGVAVGRKHFVDKMNIWLSSNGLAPDYPVMSTPMQVCNADQTMLLPTKQVALNSIKDLIVTVELCKNYQPPTQEGVLQYSQAKIDYEKGIKEGVQAEFALAAIKVFKVIPCNVSDPIVIDLDGDGIELLPIEKGVNFDLYNIGTKVAIGWVSPDDGLLVMDRNGDGIIDNGGELFGNIMTAFEDGFDQLEELDRTEHSGNGDNVLNEFDEVFNRLMVWKDKNTNGITDIGELFTLRELNIKEFDLSGNMGAKESQRMTIPKTSTFKIGDKKLLFGDALLMSSPYASVIKH
jgi:hypothetical protein